MTLDAGEAAIRTVIAAVLAQYGEASGRGLDALLAMRQAEPLSTPGTRSGAGVDGPRRQDWDEVSAVTGLG
jgi:hypothetical protein